MRYHKVVKFTVQCGSDELVMRNTVAAIRTFLKKTRTYDGKNVMMTADIYSVEYMLNWMRTHEMEVNRLLHKHSAACVNARDVMANIGVVDLGRGDSFMIQPFILS